MKTFKNHIYIIFNKFSKLSSIRYSKNSENQISKITRKIRKRGFTLEIIYFWQYKYISTPYIILVIHRFSD